MFDEQTSAFAHRSLWRRRVGAQLASLEGCRKLAGHNMPGGRSTVPSRPGGPLEHSPGTLWSGCARRSTTKAAGRPQGPFKIKNLLQKIKNRSSNPIKPNQGFIDEKNSEFFSGHFHAKSLANQQKTAQKTPQKRSKNTRYSTCFLQRQFINNSQNPEGLRGCQYLLCLCSINYQPSAVRGCGASLSKVKQGFFCQKNSQFFYHPISQNVGQIAQKRAKKQCELTPKITQFMNDFPPHYFINGSQRFCPRLAASKPATAGEDGSTLQSHFPKNGLRTPPGSLKLRR